MTPKTPLPPPPAPWPVLPSRRAWPVHDGAATRRLEQAALAGSAPQALMQRAGLAVARLAIALAPAARRVRVYAGPGNNGGDGLVAATHLHRRGLEVQVLHLADEARLPADARDALARARDAGVAITALGADASAGPDGDPRSCDLVIDALLGIGLSRAPSAALAAAIAQINASAAPVLAVDLPSGLDGDRGLPLGEAAVRATHTLSLLTLKPGCFMNQGRDHAGRIWLDDLGVATAGEAGAALTGPQQVLAAWPPRRHASHKGSQGDVFVIGGAPGMGGAALLAARAALAAGAGRVYLGRLDPGHATTTDAAAPELMPRPVGELLAPQRLRAATVVCGCGGGDAVPAVLAPVLQHAARLVLDADGLNGVAADPALRTLLQARADAALPSVLTPHPLEAARLLAMDHRVLAADRLAQAQRLADTLRCTVLLKGSGTVIASPGARIWINPTGNGRLATAGSGDVLAGWIGGGWAAAGAAGGREIAAAAAWLHGRAAEGDGDGDGDGDGSPGGGGEALPLPAGRLGAAMAAALAAMRSAGGPSAGPSAPDTLSGA